ncbi:hypothetical protein Y032_0381g350 [Ancylostoma ceylanicum]|uniref:Uncharacterized protein n=1 Tax=Ancylostoma ceylanicum TaxID=53326 RepID=A0A016RTT3_9BILA|nr:hypothetical protein Y032_0381g350 [Ancylostoma ceylanicum]
MKHSKSALADKKLLRNLWNVVGNTKNIKIRRRLRYAHGLQLHAAILGCSWFAALLVKYGVPLVLRTPGYRAAGEKGAPAPSTPENAEMRDHHKEEGCVLWQQCEERQGYGSTHEERWFSAQHCGKPSGKEGCPELNSLENNRPCQFVKRVRMRFASIV